MPEAIGEASAYGLDDLWWIIDINRQSLDHIAPEGQVLQIARLFEAKGWEVLWLKYGSQQLEFFERPGGEGLRWWIDSCSNAEYQTLLNADGGEIRRAVIEWGQTAGVDMSGVLADVSDATLKDLLMNLGGHDMEQILDTFAQAEAVKGRPVVIMAYTIKGWGLPIAGHIDNHAAQLTSAHIAAMQEGLGIADGHEWDGYEDSDPIAGWIRQRPIMATNGSAPVPASPGAFPSIPETLDIAFPEHAATQGAFGHILVSLSEHEDVAARARDHLARRGGVDQSGQLDQQARHIRAGGKTQLLGQVRRHQPGALAGDRFRSAYRTGHCGKTISISPSPCWACRTNSTARFCCRSARCTTLSWRAAWTP